MVDKGCDNCYYTYFDEKAYPCSLCIRGVERTDQWQPSKKTKADTPQTDCDTCRYGQDKHRYAHICNECGVGINNYTPQTDCGWK